MIILNEIIYYVFKTFNFRKLLKTNKLELILPFNLKI